MASRGSQLSSARPPLRILRDATGLRGLSRMLGHGTNRPSIPRRCRSCRTGRIRLVERRRLERCPHIRPSSGSPTETRLARYWRDVDRLAGIRCPTRRPPRRDHREPHVPIQPPLAASCLPTARRPRRRPTSHGQRDGARARRVRWPVRGGVANQHLESSATSSRSLLYRRVPFGLTNTNDPANSWSGNAPG